MDIYRNPGGVHIKMRTTKNPEYKATMNPINCVNRKQLYIL